MEIFFSKKNIIRLVFLNSLWIIFYSSVTGFAIHFLKINWIFLLAFGWTVWYVWHVFIFSRISKILQWLKIKNYYAILIFGQVSPGVSFFATMMLFPLIYIFFENPEISHNFLVLSLGLSLIISGILLIYKSFKTIGIGGAAFENDYCNTPNKLIDYSVYGYLRHPLFVGAFMGSLGLNLIAIDSVNLFFPLVHLIFFPIYKNVEEARLIEIYGNEYLDYKKKVKAFLPKII